MSTLGVEEMEFTWKIENWDFMWFGTFLGPDKGNNCNSYTSKEHFSPFFSVGTHSVFFLVIHACITRRGNHALSYNVRYLCGSFVGVRSCEVSIVEPNGTFTKVPMKSPSGTSVNVEKHFVKQETLTLRCCVTFSNHQDLADTTELKEKINSLFLSGELSDLTLYTGDKEFFVHKFLLRKRAPNLLEDLGVLEENSKVERVKVDIMSTLVLQTLVGYIYNGKLDVFPEENLPELYDIIERYRIDDMNDFIHLNKSATIITHLKVIRRIICWKVKAFSDETIFLERVKFDCASFLIKVNRITTAQGYQLQLQTRIQCLSLLDEDILMSCITSSGTSQKDLNHERKLTLLFSARNIKEEHILTQHLKHWGLYMQLNLSVSTGRYFHSVDGTSPILPEKLAILGMGFLSYDMQDLGDKTFNDQTSGDVTLRLPDASLRGHKAVLAAWSPVFSSMFHQDMKEKKTGEVDIPDVDFETGLLLLKFMYSGTINESGHEAIAKLYAAADKYQVASLFNKCSSVLASHIKLDNACDVLVKADRHNDGGLLETVQKFIAHNLTGIVGSKGWFTLQDSYQQLFSETQQYILSYLQKLNS